MVSLEDRMRENRRVLAEITETARTIAQAAHPIPETAHEARSELVHLAEAARAAREAINHIRGPLLALCVVVGVFAGMAGGALVALVIFKPSPLSASESAQGVEGPKNGPSWTAQGPRQATPGVYLPRTRQGGQNRRSPKGLSPPRGNGELERSDLHRYR
ncbi:MAG: hypothetical protein OXG74_05810 [Acidobacteria bacterium]|nr:hypothetical protein [Acidobacteriota bacterium]